MVLVVKSGGEEGSTGIQWVEKRIMHKTPPPPRQQRNVSSVAVGNTAFKLCMYKKSTLKGHLATSLPLEGRFPPTTRPGILSLIAPDSSSVKREL